MRNWGKAKKVPGGPVFARVAAGARMLDQRVPDWTGRVVSKKLDLDDDNGCVLAQLYGEFTVGATALSLTDTECVAYGFYPPEEASALYHRFLRKAWRAEVRARHVQMGVAS